MVYAKQSGQLGKSPYVFDKGEHMGKLSFYGQRADIPANATHLLSIYSVLDQRRWAYAYQGCTALKKIKIKYFFCLENTTNIILINKLIEWTTVTITHIIHIGNYRQCFTFATIIYKSFQIFFSFPVDLLDTEMLKNIKNHMLILDFHIHGFP